MLKRVFLVMLLSVFSGAREVNASPVAGLGDTRVYWEIKDPKSLSIIPPSEITVADPDHAGKKRKIWAFTVKLTDETGKEFPHVFTYLKKADADTAYADAQKVAHGSNASNPLYIKLESGTDAFPALVQGNHISSGDIILVLKSELSACLKQLSACDKNGSYEKDTKAKLEKKGIQLEH